MAKRHCDVGRGRLRLAPIERGAAGGKPASSVANWSQELMRVRQRQVFLGLAAVAGTLLASGCTSIRDHRGYIVDPALLDSVEPGIDNKLSVEKTLGRPTFISQFGEPDWYYVSINTKQVAFTRPRAQSEMIVKVTFDAAGNVAKVERAGMDHVVFLRPDHDKTPTLGRERTFLEDLFGNIGTVNAAGGPPAGGAPGGPNGS